jgi:hypothetical protein
MQNMIPRICFIKHYYYECVQYISLNFYKRIYASRKLCIIIIIIIILAFVYTLIVFKTHTINSSWMKNLCKGPPYYTLSRVEQTIGLYHNIVVEPGMIWNFWQEQDVSVSEPAIICTLLHILNKAANIIIHNYVNGVEGLNFIAQNPNT